MNLFHRHTGHRDPGRPDFLDLNKPQAKRTGPAVLLLFVLCLIFPSAGFGKIDLVTLSDRDGVETTIYKSEDLTLVRDSRTLQFAGGENQIQFSWANTRIDPTSLTLDIKSSNDLVTVQEMVYPPHVKDLAIWRIHATEACQAKIDILYFTSGLSWQSYYMAFLSPDGNTMDLKGYVRVSNQSGEDYAGARTRLVVGKISLLDKIAELARQRYPFGQPDLMTAADRNLKAGYAQGMKMLAQEMSAPAPMPKGIIKKGLSEYFLYTIEGKETIEDGWSRRLVSFEAKKIPVSNAYIYEAERYGDRPIHRIIFYNKKEDGLGATPLPGGEIKVYQSLDRLKETAARGQLSYKGADTTAYIPVGKAVELNLGASTDVTVEPRLMKAAKVNLTYDDQGNLTGFDEIRQMEIRLANYSGRRAEIEVVRNLDSHRITVSQVRTDGRYEKTDQDTFTFTNTLDSGQSASIRYQVTIERGDDR